MRSQLLTTACPRGLRPLTLLAGLLVLLGAPAAAHATGAPTTTTLSVDPNPAAAGKQITLSAQVSSDDGVPSGTVAFYDGAVLLTSAALAPVSGSSTTAAAEATSVLPAGGTYSLEATYESNSLADYANSTSTPVSEPVGTASAPVATTTTISTSSSGTTGRDAVTLTANVIAPASAGTPTGTVVFLDNGLELGRARLDSTGTATLDSDGFSPGTTTIEADYRGDAQDAASTATTTVVIASSGSSEAASTTMLSVNTTHAITSRETVALTAVVTASGGRPRGAVTFRDNGIVLGSAPLDASGSARLTTGGFLGGANTIEADYPGASGVAPSSATLSFTVARASAAALPTGTRLATSTSRTISSRQAVTLIATVSAPGSHSHPSGVVAFDDNGSLLGTAVLGSGGSAKLTTGGFPVGPNTIEADYRGDDEDAPSFAKITVVVTRSRAAAATRSATRKSR